MLISARQSPTVFPIISRRLYTRLQAISLYIHLGPRLLKKELGRTLNRQHVDPKGQDIYFPVEVKGS